MATPPKKIKTPHPATAHGFATRALARAGAASPLRPIIEAKPSNGLRLRSQIMTDKIIALRQDRVRRVIGHIDSETSEHLDRALLVVLGLAR
jgi:mRNA-degrading endonuclease toxin of MazEF toxin-antitoxin module